MKVRSRIPSSYILLALAVVMLICLILGGYWLSWTGFGIYRISPEFQREKTLWDWLDLLIVPIVLGVGGVLFNRAEKKNDQRLAEERTENDQRLAEERAENERRLAEDALREATLQAYLDRMSELLLEKQLCDSQPSDEVRVVARSRTLTVLRRLDPQRKASVIRFLYEANLIHTNNTVISLCGADLRHIDLSKTLLAKIDLSGVDLWCANLSAANLWAANLSASDLSDAKINNATLDNANLIDTDLNGSNLFMTKIRMASLFGANLSRTNLRESNLNGSILAGANLILADLRNSSVLGTRLDGLSIKIGLESDGGMPTKERVRANLSQAVMTGANFTKEQLDAAGSLIGATLPDGTVYEGGITINLDNSTPLPQEQNA